MKLAIFLSLVFILGVITSDSGWSMPAQVLIIRHGEKPAFGPDLSPAGRARAAALVGFFEHDPRMLQFGHPAAIFAASPATDGGSMREIETVTPLAQSLGMPLQENFSAQQFQAMVQEIFQNPFYDGRMVLICWEHSVIPAMAQALGVNNAPSMWPDSVFDRVWMIDYQEGRVSAFYNLPEHLMPGDSPNLRR